MTPAQLQASLLAAAERLQEQEEMLELLRAERDQLRAAIRAHHAQKADDRCWMDDYTLYQAAGLPPVDCRVGDKFAMLANCVRFVHKRCDGGGPWKSYAVLEAENAHLQEQLETTSALLAETTLRQEPRT